MTTKTITAANASQALDYLSSWFLGGLYAAEQIVKGDKYILHDVEIILYEPYNDLNFKDVLWSEHRWKRFLREYINLDRLSDWIASCDRKVEGISELAERGYIFKQESQSPGHKLLGNCLLGMSFRGYPYPVITMHSRSSNIFPVGYLDLSLGNLLAGEIAKVRGQVPQIHWKITSLQFDFQWFYSYYLNVWLKKHSKSQIDSVGKKILRGLDAKRKAMSTGEITQFARKRENRLFSKILKNPDPDFFPSIEEFE